MHAQTNMCVCVCVWVWFCCGEGEAVSEGGRRALENYKGRKLDERLKGKHEGYFGLLIMKLEELFLIFNVYAVSC